MTHVLLRHRDIPDINTISVYQRNGGFTAFQRVITGKKPEESVLLSHLAHGKIGER